MYGTGAVKLSRVVVEPSLSSLGGDAKAANGDEFEPDMTQILSAVKRIPWWHTVFILLSRAKYFTFPVIWRTAD